MLKRAVTALFGTQNTRELKRLGQKVVDINAQEEALSALSDDDLKAKTIEFRERLEQGVEVDALLVEAFAVCREASKRVMSMRHFDAQLIGGMVLHSGQIAEMRTGEGKTLVSTLPGYLNGLTGLGVHVVTVNDYLAQRDAEWMRPLYEFLGLTVGVVHANQDPADKHDAYAADITYGTNNEFGFDYLRDNMALSLEDRFQKDLNFAIVDEVDSILVDEARTPLIISGPATDSSALYRKVNELVPLLDADTEGNEGDFVATEKGRQIELTEKGHDKVESLLLNMKLLQAGDSLYSAQNLALLHHVQVALKANHLFHKDVDYIVQNGEIVIVDEHTGRTMPGRRWSDGIHQAMEAKEKVNIKNENQTLASTTFQNFFRLYRKLSGMTGTADTEAVEFRQIYGLGVVVIPTNKPMVRKDLNDFIYLSLEEKYQAIVDYVRDVHEEGAPVLVGTASIETSEYLSKLLKQGKIPHKVLNAKFHSKEAEIVAQAGQPGAVTIATNMAGRGTDIMLGGNWQVELAALENPSKADEDRLHAEWKVAHEAVLNAGGLHIVGTERHESRRIDNQLRGRAGRQGDPGVTRFFLSLEDNLMRIFASDTVRGLMQRLGMEKGEAIEHRWVTRAIENAQRKVEGHNFDVRKQLLEYDDVANDQRRVIYQQRFDILSAENIADSVASLRDEAVDEAVSTFIVPQTVEEQWDVEGLEKVMASEFLTPVTIQEWLDKEDDLTEAGVRERLQGKVAETYAAKEEKYADYNPKVNVMRQLEKQLMLQILDRHWKEHLAAMDHLRQGIHLRGYAQKNPKQEYQREAFELFQSMLSQIKNELVRILLAVELRQEGDVQEMERQQKEKAAAQNMQYQHDEPSAVGAPSEAPPAESADAADPFVRDGKKVGRNEDCPCGSGKKYKHCHGKINA